MFSTRDLPLLSVFAAVVRHGSFTAAAKDLGLSKSVVSDNVRVLEERCGVRLLDRTTRHLSLTDVGSEVLEAANAVNDATRSVRAIVDARRGAPIGALRIASTHALTAGFVAPVAARLVRDHPKLSVEIVSDDTPRDLVGDRFDVGIRVGTPKDSGYVIRRLARTREIIVAAPSLAGKLGVVKRPLALASAPWVRHTLAHAAKRWTFVGPRGERDTFTPTSRADANTIDGSRALIIGGAGVGLLPELVTADDIRRSVLVELCPGWSMRTLVLYALLPRPKPPTQVELFIEALRARFESASSL
jgi:DNA-binding transcriptional LysR family regulator